MDTLIKMVTFFGDLLSVWMPFVVMLAPVWIVGYILYRRSLNM